MEPALAGVLFPPRCRAVVARLPWAVRRQAAPPLFSAGFRSRAADRMIGATRVENDMDKDLIAKLAHAAGLDKALAEFPDDVAAAAAQAEGALARMKAPTEPRAEPWPPMRTGGGLGGGTGGGS
jgi:hypothetical protein